MEKKSQTDEEMEEEMEERQNNPIISVQLQGEETVHETQAYILRLV